MSGKIEVVGVNIDNVTLDEAAERMAEFLQEDRYSMIFTPNSEILVEAVKEPDFEKALNSGDLVIPDGIGVVIASRFYGTPLKERVTGFDLTKKLIEIAGNQSKAIYILGGQEGVAEEAAINLMGNYSGLKIAGTRNGYFGIDEEDEIIGQINSSGADILIAAMGAPKQEQFIYRNRDKLKVKIAIGVGGSIDILAGRAKRAPVFYQKAGLEWFYRLMKEPSRAGRMLTRLPKFIILAFYDSRARY
jgi:N-acetylglucosaminyldiphosphoundecaprenol N-acetyl-beta-D-mannosaminyltransferase